MSLYRILTLARRVVLQLLADRRTLALIIVIPLIVITVAGVLVRAQAIALNIAIVQNDQGAAMPLGLGKINLGDKLTDTLSSLSDQLHVTKMNMNDARAALERGDLDAIITLPSDFSATTVATRSINLPIEFEGSNPVAAQAVQGLVNGGIIRTLASLSVINAQASPPSLKIDATYRYGGANFDSLDYVAPVLIGLFV